MGSDHYDLGPNDRLPMLQLNTTHKGNFELVGIAPHHYLFIFTTTGYNTRDLIDSFAWHETFRNDRNCVRHLEYKQEVAVALARASKARRKGMNDVGQTQTGERQRFALHQERH